MSGVIDDNGVQWERCNLCAIFTRLEDLGYLRPSKKHKYGADICVRCTNTLGYPEIEQVDPARSWQPQYEEAS